MLIADIPHAPPSTPQVVMVAQANSSQQAATQRDHVLGVCELVNLTGIGQAELFPLGYANNYFNIADGKNKEKINWGTAIITILQQPKHGLLEPISSDGDWRYSRYLPNDGYMDDDTFVIQVEGNGSKVKLHYFVAVTDDMGVTSNPDPVCKGGQYHQWKISQDTNGTPTLTAVNYQSPTTISASVAGTAVLSGGAVGLSIVAF